MGLASTRPLDVPGLCPAGDGSADVLVDWVGVGEDVPLLPEPARRIVEATGGWLEVSEVDAAGATSLRFGYAGEHVQFAVSGEGRRLAVTWSSGVRPAHAGTLLLSTVMSYVLHLRGRLALHAGVVGWRGAAYAFAGAPGAGKSTTVGALVGRGCTAVSDDIAALSREADGWTLHGGVPGVRLTPEAQAALGVGPGATTPVWDGSPFAADKAVALRAPGREEDAGEVNSGGALPLACVVLLPTRFAAGAGGPRVVAVPPVAAVPQLAAHLLTPAWLPRTVDRERFRAVADLARETPVRRVERPDDLAALPALCDALLEEMDRLRP